MCRAIQRCHTRWSKSRQNGTATGTNASVISALAFYIIHKLTFALTEPMGESSIGTHKCGDMELEFKIVLKNGLMNPGITIPGCEFTTLLSTNLHHKPSPESCQEHDTITENKLVRKRTQAQQRSNNATGGAPPPRQTHFFSVKHNVAAWISVDLKDQVKFLSGVDVCISVSISWIFARFKLYFRCVFHVVALHFLGWFSVLSLSHPTLYTLILIILQNKQR